MNIIETTRHEKLVLRQALGTAIATLEKAAASLAKKQVPSAKTLLREARWSLAGCSVRADEINRLAAMPTDRLKVYGARIIKQALGSLRAMRSKTDILDSSGGDVLAEIELSMEDEDLTPPNNLLPPTVILPVRRGSALRKKFE